MNYNLLYISGAVAAIVVVYLLMSNKENITVKPLNDFVLPAPPDPIIPKAGTSFAARLFSGKGHLGALQGEIIDNVNSIKKLETSVTNLNTGLKKLDEYTHDTFDDVEDEIDELDEVADFLSKKQTTMSKKLNDTSSKLIETQKTVSNLQRKLEESQALIKSQQAEILDKMKNL